LKKEKPEEKLSLLPTKKTEPNPTLEAQTILIYGSPKTGKTTFASMMEEPIFLLTEEGTNALSVYKVKIHDWKTLKQALRELRAGQGKVPFKTVVIDVVDDLYEMCQRHICSLYSSDENPIQHIGQIPHGQGYGRTDTEFMNVISALMMMDYGTVFISHAKQVEVDTPAGSFQKITPAIHKRVAPWMMGKADLMLLFDSQQIKGKDGKLEEKRMIRTKRSQYHDAGSRFKLSDPLPLDFKAFFEDYKKNYPTKK
jgi:hypothetical protein